MHFTYTYTYSILHIIFLGIIFIYILVDIIIYLFVLFFRVCLFVLIFCGYCNSIVLVYCTRLLIASWAFIWTGQGWMDGGLEGREGYITRVILLFLYLD